MPRITNEPIMSLKSQQMSLCCQPQLVEQSTCLQVQPKSLLKAHTALHPSGIVGSVWVSTFRPEQDWSREDLRDVQPSQGFRFRAWYHFLLGSEPPCSCLERILSRARKGMWKSLRSCCPPAPHFSTPPFPPLQLHGDVREDCAFIIRSNED